MSTYIIFQRNALIQITKYKNTVLTSQKGLYKNHIFFRNTFIVSCVSNVGNLEILLFTVSWLNGLDNGNDNDQAEIDVYVNGHDTAESENVFCNAEPIDETYSVDFSKTFSSKKPKTGVLQKFNLALRRLFPSKL